MTELTLERDHHGDAGAFRRPENRADRDWMLLRYAPLVRRVARRVGTRLPAHVDLADLVQVGMLGLLDALQRYEPCAGVTFEAYAAFRIRGAMLDELRAQDWVPRAVRDRARELERVREAVETRLGRRATAAELAEELGVQPAEVRTAPCRVRLVSLEAVDGIADERRGCAPVADTLAEQDSDPGIAVENRALVELLVGCLPRLPQREHHILRLYYVHDLTLAEIGRRLGITESRVCQLRGRAVARLRERLRQQHGVQIAAAG
jgi:RNA polymerase sigma factor for flagellar operon FliA